LPLRRVVESKRPWPVGEHGQRVPLVAALDGQLAGDHGAGFAAGARGGVHVDDRAEHQVVLALGPGVPGGVSQAGVLGLGIGLARPGAVAHGHGDQQVRPAHGRGQRHRGQPVLTRRLRDHRVEETHLTGR